MPHFLLDRTLSLGRHAHRVNPDPLAGYITTGANGGGLLERLGR